MYLSTTIVTSSSIVYGHGLAQSFFKKEKNRTYKERERVRERKRSSECLLIWSSSTTGASDRVMAMDQQHSHQEWLELFQLVRP